MIEPSFNQYAAPAADVADVHARSTGELKLFSAQGRIGRLRYLAYGTGMGIVSYIALAVLTLVAMVTAPLMVPVVSWVIFGASIWFSALTGIKRCHDVGISGWWVLAMFIPLVGLIWTFWPGNEDANRYGPPPPANTLGVKILALLFPILIALIGVLAAIAIPQYKDYVNKAKAAQVQQQQQQQQQQQP